MNGEPFRRLTREEFEALPHAEQRRVFEELLLANRGRRTKLARMLRLLVKLARVREALERELAEWGNCKAWASLDEESATRH